MDAVICTGCKLSVEPIRIVEKSKRSDQWWRITKCPRERCGFNIDIEKLPAGWQGSPKGIEGPDKDDEGRSVWRYGL